MAILLLLILVAMAFISVDFWPLVPHWPYALLVASVYTLVHRNLVIRAKLEASKAGAPSPAPLATHPEP